MPAPARASDLNILIAAGAAVVALGAVSFLLAPGDSLPRDAGSSYAVDPAGARAAFTLLEQQGYDVRRSLEPITAIRADPSRTLIVVADPTARPSRLDRIGLTRFVEQGGTVLATGDAAVSFLPDLERRRSRAAEQGAAAHVYVPGYPSALTVGVESVKMRPASTLRVGPPWIPVYGSFDDPAVLVARLGKGRIIWWASSEPLSNGGISDAGHAELFANAIGPPGQRTVLWDEYYHGYARSFWSYVAGTPVAWGAAQCLILAVAGLLTFARRREPIRSSVVAPRTSPLEFVDTMATLYRRVHAGGAAVGTALARVRRLAAVSSGLGSSAGDDRLAAALERRHGLAARETVSTFERARSASEAGRLQDADGLSLVRELHAIEQAIQRQAKWDVTSRRRR